MHEDMQYDPILQGQCEGHEPLKVENPSIFKRHLQWALATDRLFLN